GTFGTGNDTVNAGFFLDSPGTPSGFLDGHQGSDLLVLDYSGLSLEGQAASQVFIYAPNGYYNNTIYLGD
ncbi:hypothetical protein, partial [Cereibacter sphaeroides]|uniref:hypothetical protein n=1 Tax=Cereibacter sphaeroides TaxID=1063 RepID=UPI001F3C689E